MTQSDRPTADVRYDLSGRPTAYVEPDVGAGPGCVSGGERWLVPAAGGEAIARAAEPSSRPAMLTPPDPTHHPGCTPRHAGPISELDHDDTLGPRHGSVGPSTTAAVLP